MATTVTTHDYSLVSLEADDGISNNTKRFSSIILYENGHLKKSIYEKLYPFWEPCYNENRQNGNKFALSVGLFTTFGLIVQFIFIITTNHFSRWISLSFAAVALVIHFIYFCATPQYFDRKTFFIKLIQQCLHINTSHNYAPVIAKCAPAVITNIFAIYPHIILLTFYLFFNDSTAISYVSYCASFLSIAAFYVALCSIFLYRDTIILNIFWCLLDFSAMLFVLLSLFYNNILMIVILIDLCLSCAAYIVSAVYIVNISYARRNWTHWFGILVTDSIGALFSLIIFPVMYTVNMFPAFIIDQYFRWNIIPLCVTDTADRNNSTLTLRYSLYKWIKNAPTERQTVHRLCCANMVIMDLDSVEEEPKYTKLQNNLGIVLNDYLVDFEDKKGIPIHYNFEMKSHQIMLCCYICIKVVHCIACSFVILYIAFNDNVNIMMNILFGLILILFIATAFMFCISIRSKHYQHRLLSFNTATSLHDIRYSIAYCDGALQTLKVLADIFGDNVASIMFQYIKNRKATSSKSKYKVLLLGASCSGKSTILKQLRQLYGRQFDQSELLAAKPHLTQNVIEAIRILAIYSDILADEGKNTKVCDENREIRNRVANMSDKQKFTQKHYEDFQRLWTDPYLQNVLQYEHVFELTESAPYLMENMNDYWREEYVPTIDDLLRIRQRTTGVNKIKVELDSVFELDFEEHPIRYDIFDAGGLRNERRKWIHFAHNTSAVFFCVSLAGHNEHLWEDYTNNRLKEAIRLFRDLVNFKHFANTSVIIWFTHYDRFRDKIGRYPVSEHFPDFIGNETECEIIEFFKQKFIDQIRTDDETGSKRAVHFCIGSALDTSWVDDAFNYCRNIIRFEDSF